MTSDQDSKVRFHAWGKARMDPDAAAPDDADELPPTHPLAHHSMDVAAVFLQLVDSTVARSRIETAAGRRLTDVDRDRLAALAFLHDIGKLHPAFQAKAWPKGYWQGATGGHTSESWSFVHLAAKWPEHPFHDVIHEMAAWGSIDAYLAAMFAHHGRPVSPPPDPQPSDWDRPRLSHYDWRTEATTMGTHLRRWFPVAFQRTEQSLPDTPQFNHLIAGFATLADWIGSSEEFFCYVQPLDDGYDATAHDNAKRAVQAFGQSGRRHLPRPPTFQELADFPPNPAQECIGDVEPTARLVILEAETGSGKTEAALWRFAQLHAARRVSSLYFALPTRAAARQLHRRVQTAMERIFGADAPEAVLAIPGALQAGQHKGTALPHWRVLWDDQAAGPNRWSAERATRFLTAEVAVGTVDQAMLAGLMVKHAHLRGSALSRSLLVVDEVHASGSYMNAVLKPLVDTHVALGGYVLLMSATLGAVSRVDWRNEQRPSFEAASAEPYPAVWVRGESAPRVPKSGSVRTKEVQPEIVPTMAAECAAEIASDAAGAGARVLVIRNTVQAAVETWQAVQDRGAARLLLQAAGGAALHHSRFAAQDRALLDGAVERALAPHTRSNAGCIVVGTQTLEQSLDIDADLLVTDLCPMDVLLQRIGRLHRHDLARPHRFQRPRVMVMVPERGLSALVAPSYENGLGAWRTQGEWRYIYGDVAVLELTRQLIAERSTWRIPRMNRELVEEATHPERVNRLIQQNGRAWAEYHGDIAGVEIARRQVARLGVLDRSARYATQRFPTSDERILTRIGNEGVVLDFPPVQGPFQQEISRVTLPGHWVRPGLDVSRVQMRGDGDGPLTLEVDGALFRYSRTGLLTSENLPPE